MHTVHYIADCVWPTKIHFLQMGFWTPQQSIWTNYVCAGKLMAPFQNDFLHFTSFVFLVHIVCVMIKLRWALFVTYTIIQSITSSKMCALHLTHPSTHTRSSGQLTLRRSGSSWGFGALLKGLTSVVDNSCRRRDSNPQPWVTSPTLYPLGHEHDCPAGQERGKTWERERAKEDRKSVMNKVG